MIFKPTSYLGEKKVFARCVYSTHVSAKPNKFHVTHPTLNTEWPKEMYTHFDMTNITL